jgi:DNA-binding IclR family transcriptional regulator
MWKAVPVPGEANPPARQSRAAGTKLTGIDRVLATLNLLASHPKGATLDLLSRELDAAKPTVHRGLAALARAGLVAQDERGHYRLALEYVRLAFKFYEALDEQLIVLPALEALAARFDETAHYARLDQSEVVYVAKVVPGTERVKMTSTIGGRNPAHSTGVGKALLAHALPDKASVASFIEEHGPLVARTERTITKAAALAAEMATTRERGYSLDNEENERGIVCIAFPIFLDSPSRPTGAVSLTGFTYRTPLAVMIESADEIAALIRETLGERVLDRPQVRTSE